MCRELRWMPKRGIPQGWSIACCFWVKYLFSPLFFLADYVQNLPKIKQWLWDRFAICFFFPPFLFLSLHFSSLRRNKAVCLQKSDEKQTPVAHQVTAAAGAFMEVLQPRRGEHKASLCKWVCRVRANEIYQSWCCNCGRQGFHSAREEPKYVSGEAFLPANESYFAVKKKNKKTISGNIKLPWKTLLPLMIIYEMNCMWINEVFH